MARMTDEKIAQSKRETARARAYLKVGDRLYCRGCADTRFTATMTGWDGDWICSRTKSDIHARHIIKVNGVDANFGDEGDTYGPTIERQQALLHDSFLKTLPPDRAPHMVTVSFKLPTLIWSRINEDGMLVVESVLIAQADYDALPKEQKELVGVPVYHTENGDIYPKLAEGWKASDGKNV